MAVFVCLDSSPAEAKWLTAEEKAVVSAAIAAEDAAKSAHRLTDAFTDVRIYMFSLVYFTLAIGLYGFTFWLPTIVSALGGLDYLQIGLITAIPYGASVVGMVIISRHSDRTGERRLHYVATISAGAAGLALSGVFAGNPVVSILCLSLGAVGIIGAIPVFWPMPQTFLAGSASAAGVAVINSLGNLGGYVGPNVHVWVKRISDAPSAPLYACSAILLAGAALCFFSTMRAASAPAAIAPLNPPLPPYEDAR